MIKSFAKDQRLIGRYWRWGQYIQGLRECFRGRPTAAFRVGVSVYYRRFVRRVFRVGFLCGGRRDRARRWQGHPASKTQILQASEAGVVQKSPSGSARSSRRTDLIIRLDNTMSVSSLGEQQAKARTLRARSSRRLKLMSRPAIWISLSPAPMRSRKSRRRFAKTSRSCSLRGAELGLTSSPC